MKPTCACWSLVGLVALSGCGGDGGAAGADAQPGPGDGAPDAGVSTEPDAGDDGCDEPPEPPGEQVIDLGAEGLSPGDDIDPYLEEHVQDGNQVHIPEGAYSWNGGGFTGKSLADASVVGEGEVVFAAGDGHAFSVNFTPTGGDFELRNIRIRGQRASGAHKIRVFVPDPDATLTFRNVEMPDGSEEEGAEGIFVNDQHTGTFYLIDAHIEGFADNGIYGSDPANNGQGEVHVVRGLFRNNNISNVRIGSDHSSVRGSVIIQDGPAPAKGGAVNQRGLRVRQHAGAGNDLEIENVHITQRRGGNGALVVEGDGGGSGTITGARIENDISNAPVRIRTDNSVWTGSDLHLTGEGETTPEGGDFEAVCEGEGCESPRTTKPDPCEPTRGSRSLHAH